MNGTELIILIFCLIGGGIFFGVMVACVCHRRRATRGTVVDATGGISQFGGATTVIYNSAVPSYPQQMQVQPTAVVPYQAMPPPVGQTYPPQVYPPHPVMDAGPPPPYTETPYQNSHNVSQTDDYTQLDPSLRGRGSESRQQHSDGRSQPRQTSPSTPYSPYETPYQPNVNADAGYFTPTSHNSQSDSTRYISFRATSTLNAGGSSDGYLEPTLHNRNMTTRNEGNVYDYI